MLHRLGSRRGASGGKTIVTWVSSVLVFRPSSGEFTVKGRTNVTLGGRAFVGLGGRSPSGFVKTRRGRLGGGASQTTVFIGFGRGLPGGLVKTRGRRFGGGTSQTTVFYGLGSRRGASGR